MTDILNPPVVWVNGACYRTNIDPMDVAAATDDRHFDGDAADEFEDEEFYYRDSAGNREDLEDELNLPGTIEQLSNGRFRFSFHVASAFFAMLIGKKGATKKRLESETRTRITIPKQGTEGELVINGDSKGSLISAYNRISVIIESARARQEFTHFISIPMNAPEMQDAFNSFQLDVLEECEGARGLDQSLFQTPGMLHLTIGTMSLMDSIEREKAVELLQDCKEQIVLPLIGENPIEVSVEGLEVMNDDPSEVDVVYAKVAVNDGSDKLQTLADQLVDKFVSEGLMVKQYDRVKLHLTLMNTLFRKDDAGICDNEIVRKKGAHEERQMQQPGDRRPMIRESLDAKTILEKYSSRKFCDTSIREIHLSQRRAGRRTAENYYWPSTILSIQSCG